MNTYLIGASKSSAQENIPRQIVDDEIDLRVYWNIFWNRRYLIAAVTLTAALVSALLSYFVIGPTYEASALLMISGPRFQLSSPTLQIISAPTLQIISPPSLSIDNLVPMVHNQVVAAQVATRMSAAQDQDPETLVRRVKLTSVRGTNLLRVIARDSTSGGAVALATAWAGTIVEYVDALGLDETRQTLSALENKILSVRDQLASVERALKEFQATSRIPVLEQRVQETVRRIAVYEGRLMELDQAGAPIEREVTLQPDGRAYTLTVTSIRSPTQIRRVLSALRLNLASFQDALANERQLEAQLSRRVNLARATYQFLVQKRAELRILLGSNTGTVRLVVSPVLPKAPVAPRKMLNIALAGILALMAGTVLAFVIENFAGHTPPLPAVQTQPIASSPAQRGARS